VGHVEWVPTQPFSGHVRVPGNAPCAIDLGDGGRAAILWNLSVGGVYVAIDPPLPEVGDLVPLSFRVPRDRHPVACEARVAWLNPPCVMFGDIGGVSPGLPPGCGLHFVSLDTADQHRLEDHVRTTVDARER
jgi:hypothetical protein